MRPPEYTSFKQLLTYYLCLYYLMRERNPGIKQNPKKHIYETEELEHKFHRTLEKRKYEEWNIEENRGQFRKEVDFLTGVFSGTDKQKEKNSLLEALKS